MEYAEQDFTYACLVRKNHVIFDLKEVESALKFIFRKATVSDYDIVYLIFKKAIENLDEHNIHQWDKKYPTADDIFKDIENDQMFVLLQDGSIVSAIVMNEDQDKAYENGHWSYSNAKIAVIHRLCVDPDLQNHGVGRVTMLFSERKLKEDGYSTIRLDAFSENPYALGLYNKLGYIKVGEVNFRKGKFFLFEKLLCNV